MFLNFIFIEWYNSCAYFISKLLNDSIFILLNALIYVIILQYFGGIFTEDHKIFKLLYIVFMSYFCGYFISSIVGILFSNNQNMSLLIALFIGMTLKFLDNYIIRLSSINPLIRFLSDFDFRKYEFNSMLILIYGFNRCPNHYSSRVLIEYDLEEDQQLFWLYFHWFIIYFSFLMILQFIIFMLKSKKIRQLF